MPCIGGFSCDGHVRDEARESVGAVLWGEILKPNLVIQATITRHDERRLLNWPVISIEKESTCTYKCVCWFVIKYMRINVWNLCMVTCKSRNFQPPSTTNTNSYLEQGKFSYCTSLL